MSLYKTTILFLIARYVSGLFIVGIFTVLAALLLRNEYAFQALVLIPVLLLIYGIMEWTFEPFTSDEIDEEISRSKFKRFRFVYLVLLFFGVFITFFIVSIIVNGI